MASAPMERFTVRAILDQDWDAIRVLADEAVAHVDHAGSQEEWLPLVSGAISGHSSRPDPRFGKQ